VRFAILQGKKKEGGVSNVCTILVVEDEPHVLKLVKSILATTDAYEVLFAETAGAALRISRELPRPIALLVANVILDGGTLGTHLAAALKKEHPDMKVMLINGKDRGEIEVLQRACIEQGWQLLDKAAIECSLLERIRAELGGMTATGR
jgi:DNA-binding NtrC family response regulator